MAQCGFKQRFFIKVSWKVKANGLINLVISCKVIKWYVTQTMAFLAINSYFLCKSIKYKIKIIALNIFIGENKTFTSVNVQKYPLLGSLWLITDKAVSATTFSSEDAFIC